MPISFALLLHAHQPAGNFDEVIERTYQQAYRPMLEALAAAAGMRFNVHYSGYLLGWLERHHPEHIELIAGLAREERVEVLGGGYYEPILPAIRRADRLAQLRKLSGAIAARFGRPPRGLWLAERVWEPELPETLAAAGLEYTVLDDGHFLLAGLDAAELHGVFLTEAQGRTLRLVPSSLFLRQSIPFRPVEETIGFLRQAAARAPGSLVCMGDDLEKFGGWPHTHEHVYRQGWLQRFLEALAGAADEIAMVRLSDHIASHAARGPVYVPSASYPEMMQWALPPGAAADFAAAQAAPGCERGRRFLAGAPWRSFLARYREANWLHKQQLDLSRRLEPYRAATGREGEVYAAAHDAVLAAQSNDAYWHGWFGGLYAPHLRDYLYTRLLQADRLLEELEGPRPARRLDLDCDGIEEVELRGEALRAVITPGDGGCVAELDFRPGDANLINSLQRRPELYHRQILERAVVNPAGLPGETAAPEAGLMAHLRYDAYPRSGGRIWRLEAGAGREALGASADDAAAAVAAGRYEILELRAGLARLGAEGVEKQYRLGECAGDGRPGGRLELRCRVGGAGRVGVEWVFNFLAANAPDRGWRSGNRQLPLSFEGELAAGRVELWDGWRGIRLVCEAPGAAAWWVTPTYSVSQADTGFEAVYQGSSLVAVWDEPAGELLLTIEATPLPRQ